MLSAILLLTIAVFIAVFNLIVSKDRDYTIYIGTNFARLVGWMLLDALLASILYILWFPF